WREYEGGYEDWKRQRARGRVAAVAAAPASAAKPPPKPAPRPDAPRAKLSYKEQRELDGLPARIEALEAEQAAIAAELADADLYARQPQRVPGLQARHAAIEAELLAALERWELLGAR
ncbi:MAG: ABC transporter ATP-binding protein, partial [Burkholderiales bacterium]|nr:ABC transporter ATP-binding protein [Burkholderiales bacterium]